MARWQRLYNPLVTGLLRSPLHGLLGPSLMLLRFTGRRSGTRHATPVNHVPDGDDLLVVSSRDRAWWKNLRGGAPVGVRLRGRELEGFGEAFEGEAARDGLRAVLRAAPAYRRHRRVEMDGQGRLRDPEALSRVAREDVVVRISNLVPARKGADDDHI